MSKNIKRKHNADFKPKVCLEALKERLTISEISKKYNLHPKYSIQDVLQHLQTIKKIKIDKNDKIICEIIPFSIQR
ncbi:MAG: hypothetical protein ORN85_05130 [Sediminibacterium sp.]|nr:hypothetical protein [Sediminibacterium sp.]